LLLLLLLAEQLNVQSSLPAHVASDGTPLQRVDVLMPNKAVDGTVRQTAFALLSGASHVGFLTKEVRLFVCFAILSVWC
jgi:hypothetical protein